MNLKTIYLIGIMAVILPISINAENHNDNNVTQSRPIHVIIDTGDRKQRPRMPSKQHIECCYENENLIFNFELSEGLCQLEVIDENIQFSQMYVFDSSVEATIHIGYVEKGSIYITTANGNHYWGDLSE